MIVRATSKSPRIPTYGGTRLALSTNLAARVRRFLHEPEEWWRFPDDVRDWLEVQGRRSLLPRPDQMVVETFPHAGPHNLVAFPVVGWNGSHSLACLLTSRMEAAGCAHLGSMASA